MRQCALWTIEGAIGHLQVSRAPKFAIKSDVFVRNVRHPAATQNLHDLSLPEPNLRKAKVTLKVRVYTMEANKCDTENLGVLRRCYCCITEVCNRISEAPG